MSVTCGPIYLHTPRLLLRPISSEDFDMAFAYMGSEENTALMYHGVSSWEETKEFLASCDRLWAKEEPRITEFAAVLADGTLIGDIGLSPVGEEGYIWWIFHRDYWNRGYATEAAREILRHAFEERGLTKILATCDCENIASRRVMEKIGMVRIKAEKNLRPNGHDELTYAITKAQWEQCTKE